MTFRHKMHFLQFGVLFLAKCSALFATDENLITKLNIINKSLSVINKGTFKDFVNLQYLNIINCNVASIETGAFVDLTDLREVNMSQNSISNLSSAVFSPRNKLWKLDISHNALTDLDVFDLTYFPDLVLFDVSNNKLQRLPLHFLEKLKDPKFSLLVEDNPWSCGNWSVRFLNGSSYLSYCMDVIWGPPFALPAMRIPQQATFVTCIFWICGAFWMGIIVGNVCLIRKLVFPKPNMTRSDQATQFDSIRVLSNQVFKTENRLKSRSVLLNNEDYS